MHIQIEFHTHTMIIICWEMLTSVIRTFLRSLKKIFVFKIIHSTH